MFRDLSVYRLLAFGALMMVVMIVRPQGLLPEGFATPRKKAEEQPPAPVPAAVAESAIKP